MVKEKTVKENKFDPSKHLTQIKGKEYLEVKWRLVWMRSEHPNWSIQTEVRPDFENKRCLSKASIMDEDGKILAVAHKLEDIAGFGDYVEKSETGAVGRALALCGYGTQFSPDIEEGTERIVDGPVGSSRPKYINTVGQAKDALGDLDIEEDVPMCALHGKGMSRVSKTGKAYHTDFVDGEAKTCFGHGYWTPKEANEKRTA